ncbi:MAG: hypothetical protein JNK09_14900 [Prolixibacteraceae bacterium]|nr:hypothetical protein [Prolixibacteraceae bacterium]
MIHEVSYPFHELTIDWKYLSEMLGFPDGVLPEPFDSYVEEAIQEAEALCDIRGAFYFSDSGGFSSDGSCLTVEDVEFGIGKTVAKEFRNAETFVLFICTAGEKISKRSQDLLIGENPVLGYVFDILGSMIVETAMDRMQNEISRIAHSKGVKITNRYSPGYCKWSVADQHKLFSFFPEKCCGITLSESALMHPIKSVSGVIGVGENVIYREYTCDLCNMVECFHRAHRRVTI